MCTIGLSGCREPNTNSVDWTLQNYDIKKKQKVQREELPEYDFSGPQFSGILDSSETVANEPPEHVTNEQKIVIYLSTYHTDESLKGNTEFVFSTKDSHKSLYALATPGSTMHKFAKFHGCDSEDKVGELLEHLRSVDLNANPASMYSIDHNLTYLDVRNLKNSMFSNSSSFLSHGCVYDNSAYDTEMKILNETADKLEAAGYAVLRDQSTTESKTFVQKANEADVGSASLHIVFWCYDKLMNENNEQSDEAGWFTTFWGKDGEQRVDSVDTNTSVDKKAAYYVKEKLKNKMGDDKVPMTEKVGTRIIHGIVSTYALTGKENFFVTLNWSQTPAFVLAVGRDDPNNTAIKQPITMPGAYAEAITEAIGDVFPSVQQNNAQNN